MLNTQIYQTNFDINLVCYRVAERFLDVKIEHQVLSFLRSTDFYDSRKIQTAYCDALTDSVLEVFKKAGNRSSKLIHLISKVKAHSDENLFWENALGQDGEEKTAQKMTEDKTSDVEDESIQTNDNEKDEEGFNAANSVQHTQLSLKRLKTASLDFMTILLCDTTQNKRMTKDDTSVKEYISLIKVRHILALGSFWLPRRISFSVYFPGTAAAAQLKLSNFDMNLRSIKRSNLPKQLHYLRILNPI